MKLGLVENCWWGSSVDPINGIRLAKEMGFDSYDIFPLNTSIQILHDQKRAFKQFDMPCYSFIVAANGLTDFVPEMRKSTIDYVKKQLELGYDFDSPTMVLVLGNYSYEKREFKPELQWSWAVEGVREIADYSRSLKIEIALEYVPYMFYLLDSVDHIANFIQDVNHPSVKANADVSHLFLKGDAPESLRKLQNKIINIHFSDCDGKVHGDLPPGRGVVPLKQYLIALKDIGVQCPLSIELQWPDDPARIREWVNEAYNQTAKMMNEVGVRSSPGIT
ncbi:MAG: sugar phosphate isomerase/epimerase family protein [Nitrososphaerales archaeon]